MKKQPRHRTVPCPEYKLIGFGGLFCEKTTKTQNRPLSYFKEIQQIGENYWFAYYYHVKNVIEYGTGITGQGTVLCPALKSLEKPLKSRFVTFIN